MLRLASRLGPYGLSTLITFATGIISVPFIISLAGAAQWTGLAITQSIAAIAAVVVGFGWTATGPTMIASINPADRPGVYWRSLQVRSLLFLAAAPFAVAVAMAITPLDPSAAIMGTLAYTLQALGGMWYFIGESRPYRVVLIDTTPRALAILTGLGVLWWTRSMTAYTAVLLLGTLVAALVASAVILRGTTLPFMRWRAIGGVLASQRHGVIATSAGVIYSNSPLIVASVLIPGAIEPFTLAFKLYHYATAAFQPVVQLVQGWIPSSGETQIRPRISATLRFATLGSVLLLIGMAGLLPFAASLMSGGDITVGFELSVPFGFCVAAVFLNQITGLACLTALGRADALALSSAVGAATGIALLCGLSIVAGEVGLAWALTTTEWLVTAIQLTVLARTLRSPLPDSNHPSR